MRGSRWYPVLSTQVNRWPQRSVQTLAMGRMTRLSSGWYEVDRNEQIGAKLGFNTSKHPEIDIKRKLRHSRSFEVSDFLWPRMTFDDLDTWRITYGQFVSADSKSGISFALNMGPEAQGSCKLRIITAEMSCGNGPWHSWPCVNLTSGQLYMDPRYP